LLKYTDWSVSKIAYTLGFEYPTYFNNFFNKITGVAPSSIKLLWLKGIDLTVEFFKFPSIILYEFGSKNTNSLLLDFTPEAHKSQQQFWN